MGHLSVTSKLYLNLCPWRENALERDIKIEGQIRLQVVVWLVPTGRRKRLGRHGSQSGRRAIDVNAVAHGETLPGSADVRQVFESELGRDGHLVRVRRYFAL